jgi:hypothetical protein
VQRLHSCSTSAGSPSSDEAKRESLSKLQVVATKKAASSEQRSQSAGFAAMVRTCVGCSYYTLSHHHVLYFYSLVNKTGVMMLILFFRQAVSASSSELPHYFQYVFKFILLAYAVLCLRELLHRWSNGSFLSLWSA